jgi:hypothetical protein
VIGSLGLPEMHMKGSPTDPIWHGAQGPDKDYPDAKGFVMLNSLPMSAPKLVKLQTGARKSFTKHAKQLKSKNFAKHAASSQLQGSMDWLVEVAVSGVVPKVAEVAPELLTAKQMGFGSVHVIGMPGRTYDIPFFNEQSEEPLTYDYFWKLPDDIIVDSANRAQGLAMVPRHDSQVPSVFYQRATGKRSKSTVSSGDEKEIEEKKCTEPNKRSATKQQTAPKKRAKVPAKPPKQRRAHQVSDSESEVDAISWTADPEDCVVGHFACVYSEYPTEDGSLETGLAVVEVCVVFLQMSANNFFSDYGGARHLLCGEGVPFKKEAYGPQSHQVSSLLMLVYCY